MASPPQILGNRATARRLWILLQEAVGFVGYGDASRGVDGTKNGWVAVVLEDGRFADDLLISPIESSFNELHDAEVLAIDVPIGFGPRAADAEARKLLTGAASTVFSTPSRELLERPYGPGLGISAQAHALGPEFFT